MKWLKNRFKEPSTWLALGIIGEAVAQSIETGGGFPIVIGAIIAALTHDPGSDE